MLWRECPSMSRALTEKKKFFVSVTKAERKEKREREERRGRKGGEEEEEDITT
jgi:hypothetical protein